MCATGPPLSPAPTMVDAGSDYRPPQSSIILSDRRQSGTRGRGVSRSELREERCHGESRRACEGCVTRGAAHSLIIDTLRVTVTRRSDFNVSRRGADVHIYAMVCQCTTCGACMYRGGAHAHKNFLITPHTRAAHTHLGRKSQLHSSGRRVGAPPVVHPRHVADLHTARCTPLARQPAVRHTSSLFRRTGCELSASIQEPCSTSSPSASTALMALANSRRDTAAPPALAFRCASTSMQPAARQRVTSWPVKASEGGRVSPSRSVKAQPGAEMPCTQLAPQRTTPSRSAASEKHRDSGL